MLANVSGREVPMATMVIALMDYGIPTAHPNRFATCSTIAVMIPIRIKAIAKAGPPLCHLQGGTIANKNFHPIVAK